MEKFCACAAKGSKQSASNRTMKFISLLLWILEILPHAQALQRLGAPLLRRGLDLHIEALAAAVHCNEQGAESVDAELPQRLRMQIVEVDVLDRLDPGRLERRRAADDGEIRAAVLLKSLQGTFPEAALADHQPHAVLLHQRGGKALHAVGGRGSDADRRIARWMLLALLHFLYVRGGMDDGMP